MATIDEYWVQINEEESWDFVSEGKNTVDDLLNSDINAEVKFGEFLQAIFKSVSSYASFKEFAKFQYFGLFEKPKATASF